MASAQCERQSKGRTFELLFDTSARGDADGADELLKVNLAAAIHIEDVKDVVREFSGVAQREEQLVYPSEFFLVQMARRKVLHEALVPVYQVAGAQASYGGARSRAIAGSLFCRLLVNRRWQLALWSDGTV